jgi:predicted alpha/beta hydrolase family esterase
MNVIIVHGCPSDAEKAKDLATRTYDKHWMPWAMRALAARGVSVETPRMPSPWEPDFEKFRSVFDTYDVNEDTVLIGHSCGSAFLVRWLGEMRRKVAKLILVAPWKIPDEGSAAEKAFYEYPIEQGIKERIGAITIFTSDDEEDDGKISATMFHDALGGELIELKGHGHYTIDDMGTEEFPELLDAIVGQGGDPRS